MANALYDFGREGILDEYIRMNSGDIRAMLVLADYAFSHEHKFLADMGPVDNGRTATLGGKTFSSGVFDAADTTLTALAAKPSKALIVYQHAGNDARARLIAYVDTPTSGLPFTPSAAQLVNIAWDNGPNRIFRL